MIVHDFAQAFKTGKVPELVRISTPGLPLISMFCGNESVKVPEIIVYGNNFLVKCFFAASESAPFLSVLCSQNSQIFCFNFRNMYISRSILHIKQGNTLCFLHEILFCDWIGY